VSYAQSNAGVCCCRRCVGAKCFLSSHLLITVARHRNRRQSLLQSLLPTRLRFQLLRKLLYKQQSLDLTLKLLVRRRNLRRSQLPNRRLRQLRNRKKKPLESHQSPYSHANTCRQPTPAPTPPMGAECYEYNVCEQCADMSTTTPQSCHWCARAADDGVCRPLSDLCPAAFGIDVKQDPGQCPTRAPTPAPTVFPPVVFHTPRHMLKHRFSLAESNSRSNSRAYSKTQALSTLSLFFSLIANHSHSRRLNRRRPVPQQSRRRRPLVSPKTSARRASKRIASGVSIRRPKSPRVSRRPSLAARVRRRSSCASPASSDVNRWRFKARAHQSPRRNRASTRPHRRRPK
jgi:hypothetical protein